MRGTELTTTPGTAAGRLPSFEALARLAGSRLAAAISGAAPTGSTAGSMLDRALRGSWHTTIAFLLFTMALAKGMDAQAARGYPEAWLAIAAIPAGLLLLRRPLLLGLVFAAAGIYLRVLYLSFPETCDQLAVSRAALGLATAGGVPYGIGYAESSPPGSPFPYGPLAMVTSVLGVPGEVLAAGAIMLILACCRALLTLAVLAAWIPAVEFGICGQNDQVPALLLLSGLLLLERRQRIPGAVLIAMSAAIKPYTLAWFPAVAASGGALVTMVLGAVSLVAWLPVLAWGPTSFLQSVEMARAIHPVPENTLNQPHLRILALPVAVASLLIRSWSLAVLSGALIFVLVLFLDAWASVGYWFVVAPVVGVVAERALVRFGALVRAERLRVPALSDALPATA